jgi:hypothetical protein
LALNRSLWSHHPFARRLEEPQSSCRHRNIASSTVNRTPAAQLLFVTELFQFSNSVNNNTILYNFYAVSTATRPITDSTVITLRTLITLIIIIR